MSSSPPESVATRLLTNASTIVICRLVTAIAALLLAPAIVSRSGVVGYGVWETLLAASGLLALVQGPFAGTLLWQASKAYGRSDRYSLEAIAGAGILFTLAWVLLVAFVSFYWRFEIIRILNIPTDFRPGALIAFPALMTMVAAGAITDTFTAIVDGAQRVGYSTIARSIGFVAFYGCGIALVLRGNGLYGLIASYLVGVIVTFIGVWKLVLRMFPGFRPRLVIPKRELAAEMGRYGGLLTVGYASASLRNEITKIVLATFATTTWVGYYAIASRLASIILELSNTLYGAIIAAAASLHVQGEDAKIGRLHEVATSVLVVVAMPVAIALASVPSPLVFAWVGEDAEAIALLLRMTLLGNVVAVMLTGPGTAICRGIGRVGIETRYVVVSLSANVVLTVMFVSIVGAIGSVIASSLSWIVGAVLFSYLFRRDAGIRTAAHGKAIAGVGAGVVLTSCAATIGLPWPTQSRLLAFWTFAGWAVVLTAIYWLTILLIGAVDLKPALRDAREIVRQMRVGKGRNDAETGC